MDITSLLTEKCSSLLTFEISDVEYCLSNTTSFSIAKTEHIYKMPTTKTKRYSLLRIEDKSIPVIDLQKAFTNKELQINEHSRIIITEYEDIKVGLLVERVKEIIAVDPKFISTSLQFTPDLKTRYIKGIIEFQDKKLMLLNLERIITDIGCI